MLLPPANFLSSVSSIPTPIGQALRFHGYTPVGRVLHVRVWVGGWVQEWGCFCLHVSYAQPVLVCAAMYCENTTLNTETLDP